MYKIKALVTVYHPGKTVKNNIENIAKQVDQIIICDNSKESNKKLFADIINSYYMSKNKNLGLPTAFNLALKEDTFSWEDNDFVVFFDQDSQIEEGYIKELKHSYQKVEKSYPNIGCMGPVFYNTSSQIVEIPKIKKPLIDKNYEVDNVITSSMITRYKNLKKVNFWNDNLFLDFADWDLCWRMKKDGMICVITEEEVLHHSLGVGEKKTGLIHLRVGAPFREYYQTRDVYYLLKESYVPLKMKLRLLANITIRPIVHNIFLENKSERKEYRRMGRIDYKKGFHGELK